MSHSRANTLNDSNQDFLGEVMPDIFHDQDVEKLNWQYFSDESQCLKKRYTFFGFPSSEKEIVALASQAAPLKQVTECINASHEKNEKHLLNTLVAARQVAILNLDVDLKDGNGKVIPGMAETITKLG